MAVPRLTQAQLERVVAALRGLRITGVDYALLTGGTDGREVLDWDYGLYHEPTMGLQLTSDIEVAFTFTWGSSFGCYSLEAHARGIGDFLARVGEPCGPTVVSIDHHPRWRHLLDREITDTELAWIEWVSGHPTVCWIRLDLAPADPRSSEPDSIWIIAGRWEGDNFLFATDDVTVIFDRAEAVRAKIAIQTSPTTIV